MSLLVLILTFAASTAWCAERLVRASNPAWCLPALPVLIGTWVLLLTLRVPPTPGLSLLAFGLADLAVLVLSVLGVFRLMGGFERYEEPGDSDDGDDDEPPVAPTPRPPSGRRPDRRTPHVQPHPRPRPRPGARPARRRIDA